MTSITHHIKSRHEKLPLQFWVVWIVELWERFGYYAMVSILPLFFVQKLGYTESKAIAFYGAYSAFAYGFVYLGGWLGDHVIGAKRVIMIGALFLLGGYTFLAFSSRASVFYALGVIVVGACLFKANPSSLISKMFEQKTEQAKLDSAMTLYYMAINVGSLVSTLISPIISIYSYAWAFGTAAIGLLIGIIGYAAMYAKIKTIGTPAGLQPLNIKILLTVIIGSMIGAVIIAQLLTHPVLVASIVWTIVVVAFLIFIFYAFKHQKPDRDRMIVALFLVGSAVIFFVLYNQMPTTLTFLAAKSVDRHFFGFVLPPAIYQTLNPLVIVVMSFVLAKLVYPFVNFSHSQKFAIGFVLSGIAFGLMYGMHYWNDGQGHVSNWFLVLNYFFQSTAELWISGLGVAMVAELCPKNISGFVMGLWFLSAMLAGPISAWLGAFTTVSASATNQEHLLAYANTFGLTGLIVIFLGIILWLWSGKLNRIIGHGAALTHQKGNE